MLFIHKHIVSLTDSVLIDVGRAHVGNMQERARVLVAGGLCGLEREYGVVVGGGGVLSQGGGRECHFKMRLWLTNAIVGRLRDQIRSVSDGVGGYRQGHLSRYSVVR